MASTSAETKAEQRANKEAYDQAQFGEQIMVNLEGRQIEVRKVAFDAYYQEQKLAGREVQIEKIVPTQMRISDGHEVIVTPRDAMVANAKKGDIILQNQGSKAEAPYIYGSEAKMDKFKKDYELKAGSKDLYMKKDPFAGVQLTESIIFQNPWANELMVAEAGSYLAEGGYSIDNNSFEDGYRLFQPKPQPTTE